MQIPFESSPSVRERKTESGPYCLAFSSHISPFYYDFEKEVAAFCSWRKLDAQVKKRVASQVVFLETETIIGVQQCH
jgi:hypothetical protein